MKKFTKEMMEILLETILFYNEFPSRRAFCTVRHDCAFKTEDGRNCSVGRLFTKKFISHLEEMDFLVSDFEDVAEEALPSYGKNPFKKKYRIFNDDETRNEFLKFIQRIHDKDAYWKYECKFGISSISVRGRFDIRGFNLLGILFIAKNDRISKKHKKKYLKKIIKKCGYKPFYESVKKAQTTASFNEENKTLYNSYEASLMFRVVAIIDEC